MLHYSHMACTSCSRVVPDHSCIAVSQLMWVMKRTWYHSTMTLKDIEISNSAMHVSQINTSRSLCLHIFHSAWTGTLNQSLFNASCKLTLRRGHNSLSRRIIHVNDWLNHLMVCSQLTSIRITIASDSIT